MWVGYSTLYGGGYFNNIHLFMHCDFCHIGISALFRSESLYTLDAHFPDCWLCMNIFTQNPISCCEKSHPFIFLIKIDFFFWTSTNHNGCAEWQPSVSHDTSTTMAKKLIICVFQHQTLINKQDAKYETHNLKGSMWQSLADQLG